MDTSTQSSQPPQIIVLGGWSPGPLLYLQRSIKSFRSQSVSVNGRHVEIVEPFERLPMPPLPGRWCYHPVIAAMFMIFFGLLYLAASGVVEVRSTSTTILVRLLFVLLAFGWLRLLAASVVRISIDQSIRITQKEIMYRDDPERTILIGFSWGGAVLAEMLARGIIGRKGQPSALLIAPTTSLVASIAFQQDAALRVGDPDPLGTSKSVQFDRDACATNATHFLESASCRVHVVHGTYDEASFCPNQQRWSNIIGVQLHIVPDNHVLCRPSSLRALTQILEDLLNNEAKARRNSMSP